MKNGISWSAIAALALAPVVGADQLVTEDGRILECKKAREAEDGAYRLIFEHGEFVCPGHLIAEVAIEGDMSDYVPQNEDEKKKLEAGYVRYRGKWMSKPAYEAALRKKNEERKKRTEERALHADFANAYEKETKHFLFKTNTSPELLEYYAELLEAYYKLMDKRVGIKPSPTLKRTKMTVNIYKNRREFHELSAADIGPGVAGYFWAYDQTLNFYHDYQEPAISDWVSLHECTHLLTYLIDQEYQPSQKTIWINEAVADYFGSAEITRDKRNKLVIKPGKLQTDRVLTVQQAIKDDKDVKLEELFKLTRERFHAFEYAHAWSFVYFLNESNKKYAKGFAGFFKDLYGLKGVEKNVEDVWGTKGRIITVEPAEVRRLLLKKLGVKDTDKLEREWKEFIADIAIEAPEARFKRAYNQVMRGQGDDDEGAMADLDYAIESGITDPRAYWTRGLLKTKMNLMGGEGLKDFRTATEMDPLNAAYRFSLAQALAGKPYSLPIGGVRIVFEGDFPLRGSAEELEEAASNFGLSMELAPDNDLYADTYDEFMTDYGEWKKKNGD